MSSIYFYYEFIFINYLRDGVFDTLHSSLSNFEGLFRRAPVPTKKGGAGAGAGGADFCGFTCSRAKPFLRLSHATRWSRSTFKPFGRAPAGAAVGAGACP